MENKSNSNYFIVVVILILIIVIGIVFIPELTKKKPYKVLTPEGYATGTTVSLYDGLPSDFPREIMLEDKKINYSGEVKMPDGRKQINISYISGKNMLDAINLYATELPQKGWVVISNSIAKNTALIQVKKGSQQVSVIIAPVKVNDIQITFQLEK
ncbi:MAG: hypothetical protein WCK48_02530 [bacterium]